MKFVENKYNNKGNFLLTPANYVADASTKFAGKVSKDLAKKYVQLKGYEGQDFSRHEYRV